MSARVVIEITFEELDKPILLARLRASEMQKVRLWTGIKSLPELTQAVLDADPDSFHALYALELARRGEKVDFDAIDFYLDEVKVDMVDRYNGRHVHPKVTEKKSKGKDGQVVILREPVRGKDGTTVFLYDDDDSEVPAAAPLDEATTTPSTSATPDSSGSSTASEAGIQTT